MKAQVLFPKVFSFPFTYNSKSEGKVGNLVEVPFGSKKEIGVIWKNDYSEPKNIKIKEITKKTEYTIDKKLVDFIDWFSSYNIVSKGLVLKMVIGGIDKIIRSNDKLFDLKKTKKKIFKLNKEQLSAVKFLEKSNNKFQVSVLQGTTGSGKTLVYFERIKAIIEKKKTSFSFITRNFFDKRF